jgi:valyl-tRNA synthetase
MLGDTAIAVNPDDKRFQKLIGKTVKLPLTGREVPIVGDAFVDVNFGTGAVKITPAHDPNDYEVAQRHSLPMLTVIDHEGKMTHDVPKEFRGLPVKDARQAVVDELETMGLIEKVEDHVHSVGHCYKCGTVIQPLLREQWFVDMQPLAAKAIEVLKEGKITFYPNSKKTQLITYLQGLRDWNISRQIAWGIPIPAFQDDDDPENWIFDEAVDQANIVRDGKSYHRDPDVFDTWFSSSSWPYATLNYPDGDDFKQFYPISLMETGYDIMMPWVSRMIMMGLYVTGDIPFTHVYLHGLVLDEHGAKMSKSKGNVVNPMDIVGEYGSDAFRMGIITGQSAGNNQPFTTSKIVGARNFANKLWNVARFIEDKVGDNYQRQTPEPQSDADHWILSKLQQLTDGVAKDLQNYRFSEAYDKLYHLVWDDLADWYIEASKAQTNTDLLAYALEVVLKVAHPFAPFVTETIWQTLKWEADSLLTTSEWPSVKGGSKARAAVFAELQAIVGEIRFVQTTLKSGKLTLYHTGSSLIADNAVLLTQLARLQAVEAVETGRGLQLTATKEAAWLDIDNDALKRIVQELAGKQQAQEQLIKQLKDRLANKSYVANAPAKLVQETKDQLTEAEALRDALKSQQERFTQ